MDADLNESMVGKRSGGFRISGFGLGFRLGGILGQAKVNRGRAVLPWFLPRVIVRILLLVDIQTDDSCKQSSEEQCEELPTVRRLVLPYTG